MVQNNEQTMNGVEDAVIFSGSDQNGQDKKWENPLLMLSSSEIKQEQQGRECFGMCTGG